MRTDFLIIGQGLAGSLLAWRLIQRQQRVIIIDTGAENASRVAAGIINPITGQRFVKLAEIDTILPAAQRLYQSLSAFFNQPFYIEKPMLRVFKSALEATAILTRLQQPDYLPFLTPVIPANSTSIINNPWGSILQKQTGHLLTVSLLNCLKHFFIAQHSFRQANFNVEALKISPELQWQDIRPKRIIFCEGFQAINNPWFAWLPFRPAKGEILTLHSDISVPDQIINYGHWLLPDNAGQFRLGATFDRDNINTLPTQQGKNHLMGSLKVLIADLTDTTLIRHQAQVRPCTADRQPFVGHHPQQPNISIFNGFGAKGSLQIPWYSQHFVDNLLNGTPISSNCNILRHMQNYIASSALTPDTPTNVIIK